MKPNDKQREVISAIKSIVGYWATTNDINSPSHYTLIEEELRELEDEQNIPWNILESIQSKLEQLYQDVKKLSSKA